MIKAKLTIIFIFKLKKLILILISNQHYKHEFKYYHNIFANIYNSGNDPPYSQLKRQI